MPVLQPIPTEPQVLQSLGTPPLTPPVCRSSSLSVALPLPLSLFERPTVWSPARPSFVLFVVHIQSILLQTPLSLSLRFSRPLASARYDLPTPPFPNTPLAPCTYVCGRNTTGRTVRVCIRVTQHKIPVPETYSVKSLFPTPFLHLCVDTCSARLASTLPSLLPSDIREETKVATGWEGRQMEMGGICLALDGC